MSYKDDEDDNDFDLDDPSYPMESSDIDWKEINIKGITDGISKGFIIEEEESNSESLVIEKEYTDFETFLDETREIIYEKMIDMYELITDSSHDPIKLVIASTINGNSFTSKFAIDKD